MERKTKKMSRWTIEYQIVNRKLNLQKKDTVFQNILTLKMIKNSLRTKYKTIVYK